MVAELSHFEVKTTGAHDESDVSKDTLAWNTYKVVIQQDVSPAPNPTDRTKQESNTDSESWRLYTE